MSKNVASHIKRGDTDPRVPPPPVIRNLLPSCQCLLGWGLGGGEETGLGGQHRDGTENCNSGTFITLGHSSYFLILIFFVPQHQGDDTTQWL